jgi:hypothetical protein
MEFSFKILYSYWEIIEEVNIKKDSLFHSETENIILNITNLYMKLTKDYQSDHPE